jgi:hypothetical protein
VLTEDVNAAMHRGGAPKVREGAAARPASVLRETSPRGAVNPYAYRGYYGYGN